jgi:hypothetical protein
MSSKTCRMEETGEDNTENVRRYSSASSSARRTERRSRNTSLAMRSTSLRASRSSRACRSRSVSSWSRRCLRGREVGEQAFVAGNACLGGEQGIALRESVDDLVGEGEDCRWSCVIGHKRSFGLRKPAQSKLTPEDGGETSPMRRRPGTTTASPSPSSTDMNQCSLMLSVQSGSSEQTCESSASTMAVP